MNRYAPADGWQGTHHRRRGLHRLDLAERLLDTAGTSGLSTTSPPGRCENIEHLRDRDGFHLVVDSVLQSTVVNEFVYRCDVVYHLAAASACA